MMALCRRVREKYESELKELEQSEKSTRQKFSKMKVNRLHYSTFHKGNILVSNIIKSTGPSARVSEFSFTVRIAIEKKGERIGGLPGSETSKEFVVVGS